MRRVTYGNVVATLALFLALSGGVVWAANKVTSKQIGKGAVKNKNLAKNAVKVKNLAKGSVTAAKLGKNAVGNAAIADGAVNFAKLAAGTDVVASATGGPVPADQKGSVTIPINPPIAVTPVAGQPLLVSVEARGTLVKSGTSCNVAIFPVVNGSPLLSGELVQLSAPSGTPPFAGGAPVGAMTFPLGAAQPGVPQNVTLLLFSTSSGCASGSRIDQVAVVVTEEK